jgi:hypothetical protein
MSEETHPLDEHDSALPSQEDVKGILGILSIIRHNSEIASECFEKGDYEHRDLRQAIEEIRTSVPALVRELAKHSTGSLGRVDFPELDEVD